MIFKNNKTEEAFGMERLFCFVSVVVTLSLSGAAQPKQLLS
jgi:hypothetical protein